MKTPATLLLLFALAVPVAGCGDSDPEEKAGPNEKVGSKEKAGPEEPTGYVDLLLDAKNRAKDMAALEPARRCIQQFRVMKGRLPKDLDELRADYDELPAPPRGLKFRYDPETGELDLVKEE